MGEFTFTWPSGPKEVIVTGDFDDWKGTIPLKELEDGSFTTRVSINNIVVEGSGVDGTEPQPPSREQQEHVPQQEPLKVGSIREKFYFKFIVDGEWVVSENYKRDCLAGPENNYLVLGDLDNGKVEGVVKGVIGPRVQPAPGSKRNKNKKRKGKKKGKRAKSPGLSEGRSEMSDGEDTGSEIDSVSGSETPSTASTPPTRAYEEFANTLAPGPVIPRGLEVQKKEEDDILETKIPEEESRSRSVVTPVVLDFARKDLEKTRPSGTETVPDVEEPATGAQEEGIKDIVLEELKTGVNAGSAESPLVEEPVTATKEKAPKADDEVAFAASTDAAAISGAPEKLVYTEEITHAPRILPAKKEVKNGPETVVPDVAGGESKKPSKDDSSKTPSSLGDDREAHVTHPTVDEPLGVLEHEKSKSTTPEVVQKVETVNKESSANLENEEPPVTAAKAAPIGAQEPKADPESVAPADHALPEEPNTELGTGSVVSAAVPETEETSKEIPSPLQSTAESVPEQKAVQLESPVDSEPKVASLPAVVADEPTEATTNSAAGLVGADAGKVRNEEPATSVQDDDDKEDPTKDSIIPAVADKQDGVTNETPVTAAVVEEHSEPNKETPLVATVVDEPTEATKEEVPATSVKDEQEVAKESPVTASVIDEHKAVTKKDTLTPTADEHKAVTKEDALTPAVDEQEEVSKEAAKESPITADLVGEDKEADKETPLVAAVVDEPTEATKEEVPATSVKDEQEVAKESPVVASSVIDEHKAGTKEDAPASAADEKEDATVDDHKEAAKETPITTDLVGEDKEADKETPLVAAVLDEPTGATKEEVPAASGKDEQEVVRESPVVAALVNKYNAVAKEDTLGDERKETIKDEPTTPPVVDELESGKAAPKEDVSHAESDNVPAESSKESTEAVADGPEDINVKQFPTQKTSEEAPLSINNAEEASEPELPSAVAPKTGNADSIAPIGDKELSNKQPGMTFEDKKEQYPTPASDALQNHPEPSFDVAKSDDHPTELKEELKSTIKPTATNSDYTSESAPVTARESLAVTADESVQVTANETTTEEELLKESLTPSSAAAPEDDHTPKDKSMAQELSAGTTTGGPSPTRTEGSNVNENGDQTKYSRDVPREASPEATLASKKSAERPASNSSSKKSTPEPKRRSGFFAKLKRFLR